ncbi:MAG: hypothetical protein AAFN07_16705 [Pseudomonadota bacterium]
MQRIMLVVASLLVAGTAMSEATIELVSEPGDSIGQGNTYSFDDTNTDIRFFRNYDNGITVRIQSFPGEPRFSWTIDFAAPFEAELTVGPYEGATRFPFQDYENPGLAVSGNGRGCNRLTGSFDIFTVEYDEDGNVTALAATFEQFCGASSFPLRGEIVFNTVLPIGVKSLGLGLTRVHCLNRNTKQVVIDRAPIDKIGDCRALGLEVSPGDSVRVTMFGIAEE